MVNGLVKSVIPVTSCDQSYITKSALRASQTSGLSITDKTGLKKLSNSILSYNNCHKATTLSSPLRKHKYFFNPILSSGHAIY